jgi:signal peptidase I
MIIVAAVLAVVGGVLARPTRHVVEGWSMAPRIRPGDVIASSWFPAVDGWRRPARWDRWVLLTDEGLPIVKRVVGLPGEAIAISVGDLVVDGVTPLKPPTVLAELGVAVPLDEQPADVRSAAAQAWTLSPRIVWDDVVIEPGMSRRLEPVRDVGVAVEVRVTRAVGGGGAPQVWLQVGEQEFRWPITASGRFAIVAGRLDGHAVAAMWRLGPAVGTASRSPLPPGPPAAWDVAVPWTGTVFGGPGSDAVSDDRSPALAIAMEPAADGGHPVIERVTVWRDVHYRPLVPAATGWQLGDAYLVLGDFPDASIDSRRFGPVDRPALQHRVHSVR